MFCDEFRVDQAADELDEFHKDDLSVLAGLLSLLFNRLLAHPPAIKDLGLKQIQLQLTLHVIRLHHCEGARFVLPCQFDKDLL